MSTDADALRDPATGADPYPVYDRLRPSSPIQTGSRSWILLRHDQVRAALADPERFSSDVRATDNPVFRDSPLVFDDPPHHGVLRRLVNTAFTPRRIAGAEPWIRRLADQLLDDAGSGPFDFVEAVADPLPVRVIARLLGVPEDQHRQFKQWSNDRSYVIYHSRAPGPKSPELLAAEAGCQALTDLFLDLAGDRRRRPGDDLLSALATAEVDGESLAIEDVAGVCCVLLTAGNLTTTRLLSTIVVTMAQQPDTAAALRSDPEVRAELIEACLRVDSPVQMPIRKTTTPVEVDGVTIPAGHFVTLGIGAANRDPAAYPGDEAGADAPPHLAFGHGIHYCLGAALARLEAQVAIAALLDRYATIELSEPPEPEPALAHGGYRRVQVSLSA